MKKVKFYVMAFAALCFGACADDAIESPGQNTGTNGEGTPAYLTISFTANGGSSTRAEGEGTNTGDQDGTSEDSGHENAGTTDETAVKTALLVVLPTDLSSQGSAFAKTYTALNGTDNTENGNALTIVNKSTSTYSTDAAIEIAATKEGIEYEVVVIVNPVSSLTSTAGLAQGITDLATVRSLYDKITTGNYSNESATGYEDAADDLGNSTSGFMMANKGKSTVTVTTENTPEKPAQASVEVERVLSKITFRPQDNKYAYEVKSTLGTPVKAKSESGAFLTEEPNTYAKGTFNEAKDLVGQTVYTLFDDEDNSFKGLYRKDGDNKQTVGEEVDLQVFVLIETENYKTEEEYAAETNATTKANWVVLDKTIDGTDADFSTEDILGSIEYEMEEGVSTETTFYVKLEGYALINLSNSVNYVRHKTTDPAATVATPFGVLNTSDYLWTPNWADKNAVSFDENGEFTGGVTTDKWFYNTLAKVSEESKDLTVTTGWLENSTYFNAMPTTDETVQDVEGTGDKQHTGTLPGIGRRLGYCFENSVAVTQQRHGLTTGIAFVATIWEDEACQNEVDLLYRYAGNLFTSLKEIADAYGASADQAIKDLAAKEVAGEEITKEDLEKARVDRYQGNICYYYTSEIKHYDNGDNTSMGIMEYAIMRNNIYALSVKSISDIGDPFIDPTPGIENETETAALEVEAEILPWIVRYNDIEF